MSILNKTAATLSSSTAVMAPEDTRTADEALLERMEEIRDAVDFDEMRGHYQATYGKETTLDDETILRIVALSEDDKEPKDWAVDMRQAETEENEEEMTVSPSTSLDVATFAHALGGKLAANTAFVDQVDKIGEAKQLTARGPAVIFQYLKSTWSAEEWSSVPRAGVKKTPGMNEPFDIWMVPDMTDPKKKTRMSFFTEVARSIPYFQNLETQFAIYSEALKSDDKRSADHITEARKIASTIGRSHIKAAKANYTGKKNTFMGNLKKATQLQKQIDACNRVPNVRVDVLVDKQPDGTLAVIPTNAPIEVSRIDKPAVAEVMTVNSFLKLKAGAAMVTAAGDPEKGLAALIATNDRAPKDKGKGATTVAKYPAAESVDDIEDIMSEFTAFLDVDDKTKRDNFIKLGQWFKSGTLEERDEKVRNFAKLKAATDDIWTRGVRQAMEELQKRENATDERAKNMGLQKTG